MTVLRFSAYENFVASQSLQPIGREGLPAPVLQLQPVWEIFKRQGCKSHPTVFPLNGRPTTDFFRPRLLASPVLCYTEMLGVPVPEMFLRAAGASFLSWMLDLRIVADANLADLGTKVPDGMFSIGCIQKGIRGKSLEDCSPEEIQTALTQNPEDATELYLYTIIASDVDQQDRNVILEDETHRLFSIDNELSGSRDYATMLELPDKLSHCFQGQPIPKRYLEKIKAFLNQRLTYGPSLLPFYPADTIIRMFKHAESLLKIGKLIPKEEARRLLS